MSYTSFIDHVFKFVDVTLHLKWHDMMELHGKTEKNSMFMMILLKS